MPPRLRALLPHLAPVAAGAWIALGAPPFDLWIAVPTGLALFAALIELAARAPRRRTRLARALVGGATGFVFGTTVNVFALGFVPSVIVRFTPLPWVAGALALLLVSMLQSLAFTVTAVVTVWLRRVRVPLPIAFAIGHLLGTHAPAVFPWTVAAGLIRQPWSVQTADIWGEPGAASLWALIGGVLAAAGLHLLDARRASDATSRRGHRRHAGAHAATALLLIGASFVHGRMRMAQIETQRAAAPSTRIGLAHPAYPATLRWDPNARESLSRTLHELTAQAEAQHVALTVWPESAHPYPIAYASRRDQRAPYGVLGHGVHGPVLAGVLRRRDAETETNSAVLVEPDGHFERPYDKLFLLAFGEHVPLADQIPWLKKTFARGMGLVPGDRNVVQHTHGSGIDPGILICFEDTLPAAARSLYRDMEAGERIDLIANLTNDGWFTGTTEPLLHLRLASLRTIETRLDMVRSVNGGYSAHVDATGTLRAEEHRETPQLLVVEPRLLEHEPTLFVRWGETPALVSLALAAALGAFFETKRKRRSP